MRFCAILLTTAVVASPALAQDSLSAPVTEKKICKTITPTGTIMGKRFCLTKVEWQQLNDINERNAEQGMNGRKMNVSGNADH